MHQIQLSQVSKRFSKKAGVKLISNWRIWNTDVSRPHWFWSLQDISLKIKRGSRAAILGTNGSGKTTLLKIIAGVSPPTLGSVMVRGRVIPVLELFSGLQPDYTGRENIYLNAAILGMRRSEINACFDSIIDFANIRDFIDMPIKHYSLGMRMRLGFSVATHATGSIFMVDEVWSVGDSAFQEKSIKKLHELNDRGATLLTISHDPVVVHELADYVYWLDKGQLIAEGETKPVMADYENFLKTGNKPTTS